LPTDRKESTVIKLICSVVLLAASASVGLAQQQVALDKSEVKFAGKQMGVPAEGQFKKFSADVNLDPTKPESTRAQIAIDANSIDLGSAEFDTEVKRKPWLDAAGHPQAKFVSSGVKATGNGRYEMTGKLTIKGITREVVVPFSMQQESGVTTAQGAMDFKRLDFKLGEGPWEDLETVANEVQIRFRLVANGAPR
jgi:polyisoprenoid-binding protein YceI